MSTEPEPVELDAEIVEQPTPLTETDAKRLDKKIRLIVGNISDELDKLAGLIAEAKAGQIQRALGFKSWTAYLASVAEIGWQNRDDRRKIVALLSGEGMSQRAIASTVGVSQKTVDRDLELSHDDSVDAKVVSLDNKRRPKHPKPKPKPAVADVVIADPARKFLDALSHVTDATISLGRVANDLVGLELTSEQTVQIERRFEKLANNLDMLRASASSGSVDDELRNLLDDDA